MSSLLQWMAVDRNALQAGLLAACCIVAIALAAASLSSPVIVESAEGDGLFTEDSEFGVGEEGDGFFSPGPPEAPPEQDEFGYLPPFISESCYPIMANPLVLLVLFSLYLGTGAIASRVFDLGVGVTIVVLLVMLTIVAMLIAVSGCPWELPEPSEQLPIGEGSLVPEEEGGEGDSTTSQPIATPTIVLVALLVLTLVGVLGALYVGRSEEEDAEPEPEELPDAKDPTLVGAVAGRTADAIEDDATLENAVYRAWSDMTGALAVEQPEASTPGEFAEAATDAGMDPDDVAELTGLFEMVRYGDAEVTPEREQRAIETLRRIESTYGEDEQ